MRITPTLIAAAVGGFSIATGLIALAEGAPDAVVWLAAGLAAEAAAVGLVVTRRRGAAPSRTGSGEPATSDEADANRVEAGG